MAVPVMCDAAESVVSQEYHLVFPCVRAQGPAVAEDDGLSFTPILVVDLRAVFGCDRGHKIFSPVTIPSILLRD